jgi:hypothetical protein
MYEEKKGRSPTIASHPSRSPARVRAQMIPSVSNINTKY